MERHGAAAVAVRLRRRLHLLHGLRLRLLQLQRLLIMWSLGLACKDIFALRNKKDLHTQDNLFIIVMVDWVVAIFMFSGACSSASLTIFFMWDVHFCEAYTRLACRQFALSVVLAFITWLLQAASSFSGFWLLVSLF
ncbi:CASP-like protein 5B3 isoform X2 [Triticum dicoccoides]|uniref:CASP-like protein 5B3 isoform X2 n=1 Tax=Triticum dicoccoides TaxID=85692 RepID=UPI00188F7CF3|nr:CASP-like protein 5B3 isoform X2 [Triticum dicoccoides]XP_044343024.1 CASP-like protein 5B3 isoform X2 [Triticum aestivum]